MSAHINLRNRFHIAVPGVLSPLEPFLPRYRYHFLLLQVAINIIKASFTPRRIKVLVIWLIRIRGIIYLRRLKSPAISRFTLLTTLPNKGNRAFRSILAEPVGGGEFCGRKRLVVVFGLVEILFLGDVEFGVVFGGNDVVVCDPG
jgi:hypothetical protein